MLEMILNDNFESDKCRGQYLIRGDVKSRVYAYVTRAHEVKCPLWNSLNLDERFNQAKNVNNAAWTLSLYTRALKRMEISW